MYRGCGTSPSTVRRLLAASLLAAAALAPARAAAQSPKEIAAARRAFQEGDEAEGKGDYPTALARFQAALAVKSTAQLHLRVGVVEEKLGKLRDALASYQRALALASALPAVGKVAREQIEGLQARIPTVTVTVAQPPPGLTVTLDDAPLAASVFGTAMPLDPGAHRLHAEAPGRVPRDEAFTAAPRSAARFTIELAPLAAPERPAAPSKVPGGIATGGGAAALAVGALLIGLSVAKDGSIDGLCGGAERLRCPESKREQILGDVSTVNALRFSGLGVGILGAAGVAVGTALLVKAARPQATAVRVVPLVGVGMVGVGGWF